MNVLFIPDARGNGHRIRCQALAEELERRGHLAVVINASESVPSRTFKAVVIDLRGDIGLASAVDQTIRIVDDLERDAGACDLLVLGCAAKPPIGVMGRALAGPEYSLLRTEFRMAREVITDQPRIGILDVRPISDTSAVELACSMATAAVVITYGGMRAMEAACVGAPMVVVPRNRGEHLNARGLEEAGAAIVATEGMAKVEAELLLRAKPVLEKMSRAGRDLVDGRGCERVADEIERLCR